MTTPPPEVPAAPTPLPPAGWYPDPNANGRLRRWTGTTWTDEATPSHAIVRNVGFGQAIALAFKGAFTYRGRSTAPEFWWFFLFNILVTIGLYVMVIATTPTDPYGRATGSTALAGLFALLFMLWFIVSIVVQIPLIVRRLHDKDMTGWLVLLAFVPFGSLIVLILLIGAGNPGPNRFGPVAGAPVERVST